MNKNPVPHGYLPYSTVRFDLRASLAMMFRPTFLVASVVAGVVGTSGAAVAASPLPSGNATVCWKNAVGRGVGKPVSACSAAKGLERSGALCYPKCKQATPSYYGVGPVCWQHCADGWVDEGALCRKSGSIETVAKKSYGAVRGLQ